jgi:hypothetical protein
MSVANGLDGRTQQEVKDDLKYYLHISTRQAEQALACFRRPVSESYTFTYTSGATLLQPWLQGAGCFSVFARFLTEPYTPSALLKQASAPEPYISSEDHSRAKIDTAKLTIYNCLCG